MIFDLSSSFMNQIKDNSILYPNAHYTFYETFTQFWVMYQNLKMCFGQQISVLFVIKDTYLLCSFLYRSRLRGN